MATPHVWLSAQDSDSWIAISYFSIDLIAHSNYMTYGTYFKVVQYRNINYFAVTCMVVL